MAAFDLLHRMRQPAGCARQCEDDDRRLLRQVEGGRHGGKREIGVDRLAHHLFAGPLPPRAFSAPP